jgi:P-type Ca2+ transporter type 2B
MVLEACSHYLSFDGELLNIDYSIKKRVEQAIEDMANKALRTIVIAFRDLSGSEDTNTKDEKGVFMIEKSNLTLLAVFGIKDILRQEVTHAVEQCKMAGIKVRMVTGDNKLTARAIAKECKIIENGDEYSLVMEGQQFNQIIGGVIIFKLL